jgi:PAS domain S-box-containing protein
VPEPTRTATPRSLTIPPDLGEVAEARRFVSRVAAEAGFPEERVFDITVACSEAVANAIEHSPVRGEVHVRTVLHPDRLEIEVQGPGRFQPPDRLKERDNRGLGLPLMARLSDHLALFSGPRGETFVSLTFYRPGVEVEAQGAVAPSFANLAEENRLLDDVLTNFPDAFYVLDDDWRFLYLNPSVLASLGKTRDEIIGETVWDTLPGWTPREHQLLETAKTTREGLTFERAVETPFGWREWTVFPVEEGLAVISRDITERKQAEEALQQSADMLRLAEEAAAVGAWVWDIETGALKWDEQLFSLFGLDPVRDEASFATWRRVIHREDEPAASARIDAAVVDRAPLSSEYRIVMPDGTIRWIYAAGRATYDPRGRPLRMIGICLDISERRRSEEKLRESEDRLRLSVDNLEDAFTIYSSVRDAEGDIVDFRIEYANDAACALTNRSREDYVGRTVLGLYPGLDRTDIYASYLKTVESGEPFSARDVQFDTAAHARSGIRYYDYHISRLADGFTATWRDVTDHHRAAEAIRESEERYRALAEENERLYRQQLDIAQSLQLALLNIPSGMGPVRLGHLYRSATQAAQVGGDFYDAFEVKGDKVAMLVGDVAGHGIEAARTATLVKDVVHAFIHQSLRPHQVLRRTNDLLLEKDLPGFVSLFLAVLDTQTGLLRYASAGHPETLLRRSSGEIQVLGTGAPPLGIFPDAKWKTNEIDLEQGDLLLLYTDGVVETRRDTEFFGQKRLERLLKRKRVTVERLPHLILDQLLAFSHGTLTDDVAVLALQLQAKAEPKRDPGPAQESLLP